MTRLLIATFALAALLSCAAMGHVLGRIDRAHAQAAQAHAAATLLRVEVEALRLQCEPMRVAGGGW